MTTIREVLAILVTADTKGAVSELEKVGAAATTELDGKAAGATKNLSATLLKGGAAAVGFATVVGAGLLHAAHGYEEAERASLKLDNTIANEPRLAGASRAAFDELASSISATTRVRKTDAVAAEALLGQFDLTQQQIKELLPLIVDLSVKTGLDLDTAVRKVGKSIETQKNGLKSQGVEMDAAALKADAFGTVMNGLRGTVGGFAEKEGKTFSGQLAILHNQFDQIKENVGKGVVEAYSSALEPVVALSDAIANSSPQTQEAIGNFVALGTVAVGAAGGVATLAGGLVDAKDAFLKTNEATGKLDLTAAGKAGAIATIAAELVALALTVKGIVWPSSAGLLDVASSTDEFAQSLLGTTSTAAGTKTALAGLDKALSDWASTQGAASEQTGVAIIRDLGISYKEVGKIVSGSSAGIDKWVASLHLSEVNAGTLSTGLHDLHDSLEQVAHTTLTQLRATGELNPKLLDAAIAMKTSKNGTVDYIGALHLATSGSYDLARATGDAGLIAEETARHWKKFAREVVDADDALIAFYEHELDRHDATRAFASAQREATLSVLDAKDAQKAYDDAVREHGANSEEAIRADLARQAAVSGVTAAYDDQIRTALDLAASQSGYKIGSQNSGQATQNFVNKLIVLAATLGPDSALRKELDAYIGALHRVPTDIVTTFRTVGGAAGSVTGAGGHRTFASGGDPPVGVPVLVGEHGRELVDFDPARKVSPALSSAGADPTAVVSGTASSAVRRVVTGGGDPPEATFLGEHGRRFAEVAPLSNSAADPTAISPADSSSPVRRIAASSDPRSGDVVWVGVHGPELVQFSAPVHVYPHGQQPDPTRPDPTRAVRHFAAGGDPRVDEPVWVGERGKELVRFHGSALGRADSRHAFVATQAVSHHGFAPLAGAGAAAVPASAARLAMSSAIAPAVRSVVSAGILRVPGAIRDVVRRAVQQERVGTARVISERQRPALVVNGPMMEAHFDGSAPSKTELDVAARELDWRLGNRVSLSGRR